MMATRCGIIDPGVLLYLGRQGRSVEAIEDMLYRRSGLLGRVRYQRRCARATREHGARRPRGAGPFSSTGSPGRPAPWSARSEGLTASSSPRASAEHAAAIRAEVCARLAWLGLRLDAEANLAHARSISLADSAIQVRVIPMDEEAMIAHHTQAMIRHQAGGGAE